MIFCSNLTLFSGRIFQTSGLLGLKALFRSRYPQWREENIVRVGRGVGCLVGRLRGRAGLVGRLGSRARLVVGRLRGRARMVEGGENRLRARARLVESRLRTRWLT